MMQPATTHTLNYGHAVVEGKLLWQGRGCSSPEGRLVGVCSQAPLVRYFVELLVRRKVLVVIPDLPIGCRNT